MIRAKKGSLSNSTISICNVLCHSRDLKQLCSNPKCSHVATVACVFGSQVRLRHAFRYAFSSFPGGAAAAEADQLAKNAVLVLAVVTVLEHETPQPLRCREGF